MERNKLLEYKMIDGRAYAKITDDCGDVYWRSRSTTGDGEILMEVANFNTMKEFIEHVKRIY